MRVAGVHLEAHRTGTAIQKFCEDCGHECIANRLAAPGGAHGDVLDEGAGPALGEAGSSLVFVDEQEAEVCVVFGVGNKRSPPGVEVRNVSEPIKIGGGQQGMGRLRATFVESDAAHAFGRCDRVDGIREIPAQQEWRAQALCRVGVASPP